MSCHVMLLTVMLCYVMLCYVMLCYVMLCYVMLCYVMLCYVMLWQFWQNCTPGFCVRRGSALRVMTRSVIITDCMKGMFKPMSSCMGPTCVKYVIMPYMMAYMPAVLECTSASSTTMMAMMAMAIVDQLRICMTCRCACLLQFFTVHDRSLSNCNCLSAPSFI